MVTCFRQTELITFATSLDQNQDPHTVGSDLDPNRLTLIVLLKDFFEKVYFEKSRQITTKVLKNTPACRVKYEKRVLIAKLTAPSKTSQFYSFNHYRECSGSVVEFLT